MATPKQRRGSDSSSDDSGRARGNDCSSGGCGCCTYPNRAALAAGNLERAAVLHNLETTDGKDLIFVTYSSDHDVNQEWVYNRADIDASRVVWARDMGDSENRKLMEYFRGRRVWRLFPDKPQVGLTPYSASAPN